MKAILLNDNPAISRLITLSMQKLGIAFKETDNLDELHEVDLLIIDGAQNCSNERALELSSRVIRLVNKNEISEELPGINYLHKPFLPTDFNELAESLLSGGASFADELGTSKDAGASSDELLADIGAELAELDELLAGDEFEPLPDLDGLEDELTELEGDEASDDGELAELEGDETSNDDDLAELEGDEGELLELSSDDESNVIDSPQLSSDEDINIADLPELNGDEMDEDLASDELENISNDANEVEINNIEQDSKEQSDDELLSSDFASSLELDELDEINESSDLSDELDKETSETKEASSDIDEFGLDDLPDSFEELSHDFEDLLKEDVEANSEDVASDIESLEELEENVLDDGLDETKELSKIKDDEIEGLDELDGIESLKEQISENEPLDEIETLDEIEALVNNNEELEGEDEEQKNSASELDILDEEEILDEVKDLEESEYLENTQETEIIEETQDIEEAQELQEVVEESNTSEQEPQAQVEGDEVFDDLDTLNASELEQIDVLTGLKEPSELSSEIVNEQASSEQALQEQPQIASNQDVPLAASIEVSKDDDIDEVSAHVSRALGEAISNTAKVSSQKIKDISININISFKD